MPLVTMDFGQENTRGKQALEWLGNMTHNAEQRLRSVRTRSSDPARFASSRDPTRETYPSPSSSPMTHQT